MDDNRWYWALLLIATVLGGAGLLLYTTGLKPGIDLAGGSTLVYEVEVQEGESTKLVIESTIETLKKRVDPNGVMNLLWRPLTGNRFEVQMPAPRKEVKSHRQRYRDARKALQDTNISRGRIETVLNLDSADRRVQLLALAGGNERSQTLLDELAKVHDEIADQESLFDEAEAKQQLVEQQLSELPEDEDAQIRQTLEEEAAAKLEDTIERAGKLNEARARLGQVWQRVLATNVNRAMLDAAMSKSDLPGRPVKGEQDPAPSEREIALTLLKQQHPDRAAIFDDFARTYADYEDVKGPLDDAEDLKVLLRGSGVLEFRIAPRVGLPNEARYREQLANQGPRRTEKDTYRWFEIEDVSTFADSATEQRQLLDNPAVHFANQYAGGPNQKGLIADRFSDRIYLLLSDDPGSSLTENRDVSASAGPDDLGLPSAHFRLNTVGGPEMAKLTSDHKGEHMAILLDGKVISAPVIQSMIAGRGMISKRGGYTQQELRYLTQILNAGSLQARISDDPIYQKSFDAAFGRDNLEAGLKASIWALIVVSGFIASYYLFLGAVADFALFGNMLLILGIMSFIQATFTLPGIAAIVLTIGMAVDANVLIFERIREELQSGAQLRAAVRSGYGKALSAIIDANLTTLITCLVLGYTATTEVKGFAVTLGIGILATMFTALLCTRTWIELYLHFTKSKPLHTVPSLVPTVGRLLHPNVDWVGKRFACLTTSAVLMIAGVTLVYQRGEDMLDIEFRSGTQVSFTLADEQKMELAEVKRRLTERSTQPIMIADLDLALQTELDKGIVSPSLRQALENKDISLSDRSRLAVVEPGARWSITDQRETFVVSKESDSLNIYTTMEELAGDRAKVVISGTAEGTSGGAFTIQTLALNTTNRVSLAVTQAFEDVIDTKQAITFKGANSTDINKELVRPIQSRWLGESIDRPEISDDVGEFIGGVAIVIESMNPPTTVDEVRERIERVQNQPPYEDYDYRQFQVIGLDLATQNDVPRSDQPNQGLVYRSVVIVANDNVTNYLVLETPEQFTARDGLAATQWELVRDALTRPTSLGFVSNISPQISRSMAINAIGAIVLSLLAVVAYIWLRFGSIRYGLAAIVALVHDVTIALGLLAIAGSIGDENPIGRALLLTDFKVDLSIVSALLTIVGYSLNDTIVIFDRIRENRGRLVFPTPAIINNSLNQTISRTVLTSLTTALALLTLYFFGGDGVHGFAFTMLVGVVVGTYSSIAIAAPIVLLRGERQEPVT